MPVLLKSVATLRRKPPPFRSENWWKLDPHFKVICEGLISQKDLNWGQLIGKFRTEVKVWLKNRSSPHNMLLGIEKEMQDLLSLTPGSISKEEEYEIALRHQRCLLMNEAYWQQRARIDWIVSGDNNSRFFHAMAVARKRRNQINAILVNGDVWETCQKKITTLFVSHFRAIYTKQATHNIYQVFNPHFLSNLPKIPALIQPHLESIPSDQEIEKAVMDLGSDKAPGLDGLHARLIQENWEAFGHAVISEVRFFFVTGTMKDEVARTNLVLISKREDVNRVEHFRPVLVCNVIYKTISKILTSRLKPFISDCISPSQSAFVPGRDIAENMILLREILHSFRQPCYRNPEFCLKVDLSKALTD